MKLPDKVAKALLLAGAVIAAAALAVGGIGSGDGANTVAIAGFVVGALMIGVSLIHYIMNPIRRAP